MILVLERRKGHSKYPFSSFSLLFLLAFDSINELVGVNGVRPRPYNDHESAWGGARSHSRGRGGGEGRSGSFGTLWLPWGGGRPLAQSPVFVAE